MVADRNTRVIRRPQGVDTDLGAVRNLLMGGGTTANPGSHIIANNPTQAKSATQQLAEALLRGSHGIQKMVDSKMDERRMDYAEAKQAEAESKRAAAKSEAEQRERDRINAGLQALKDFNPQNPESFAGRMLAMEKDGQELDAIADLVNTEISGMSKEYQKVYLPQAIQLLGGMRERRLNVLESDRAEMLSNDMYQMFSVTDPDTESWNKTIRDNIRLYAKDSNNPQASRVANQLVFKAFDSSIDHFAGNHDYDRARQMIEQARQPVAGGSGIFLHMTDAERGEYLRQKSKSILELEKKHQEKQLEETLKDSRTAWDKELSEKKTLPQMQQYIDTLRNSPAKDNQDQVLKNIHINMAEDRMRYLQNYSTRLRPLVEHNTMRFNALFKEGSYTITDDGRADFSSTSGQILLKDGRTVSAPASTMRKAFNDATRELYNKIMAKGLDPDSPDAALLAESIYNHHLRPYGIESIKPQEEEQAMRPSGEDTLDLYKEHPAVQEQRRKILQDLWKKKDKSEVISYIHKAFADPYVRTSWIEEYRLELRQETLKADRQKKMSGDGTDRYFRVASDGSLEYVSIPYTRYHGLWEFLGSRHVKGDQFKYAEGGSVLKQGIDAEKSYIVHYLGLKSGLAAGVGAIYPNPKNTLADTNLQKIRFDPEQTGGRYLQPSTLGDFLEGRPVHPGRRELIPQALKELQRDGIIRKNNDGSYTLNDSESELYLELFAPQKKKKDRK